MNAASQQDRDTAGAVIRPPLLFPVCLILGLMLDRTLPLPFVLPETTWVRWTAGGGLILFGTVVFAAGLWNFARAGTPVPGNRPVRALVTTGIHGLSRNPIYVGMFLLYAGLGLAAQPVDSCPRAASCHHHALRRGRVRGSLSRAALRRCLPRLQGACPTLAVTVEQAGWHNRSVDEIRLDCARHPGGGADLPRRWRSELAIAMADGIFPGCRVRCVYDEFAKNDQLMPIVAEIEQILNRRNSPLNSIAQTSDGPGSRSFIVLESLLN